MANSENQIFTFTWRIDNFNICPLPEFLDAPGFVVDFLENTEWRLRIVRSGIGNESLYFMDVSLERAEGSEYTQDITIAYSLEVHFTFQDQNVKFEMISTKFRPGDSHYRQLWIEYDKELLLNDTLIIRCQMSRCMEEVKTKDVFFESVKRDFWNLRVPYKKYECSVRSRVLVTSKSFVWPIHRIAELPDNVKVSTSLPSVTKSQVSFDFSLYLKEDPQEGKGIYIEIHIKNVNNETLRAITAHCRIRTVGAPRNIQFRKQNSPFIFGEQEDCNWSFLCFVKMKDLAESYLDHTKGTLYLKFDLTFSTGNAVQTEISEGFPLDDKQRDISPAFTSVVGEYYRDREYADATLRVRDREFKAHKLILVTRSEVFRRMFQSEMKEESGIVDIDDVDPNTVERLLKYMYTEEVEDLNLEDAAKLYYAADKYNIGSLKERLRSRIIANLSLSNVCEALVLADAHNDGDLSASIVDYIHGNSTEIFHSDMWKDFAASHGSLAATSMIQVFTRKSVLLSEEDSWGGCAQQRKTFISTAGSIPSMSTMTEVLQEWLLSIVRLSIRSVFVCFCLTVFVSLLCNLMKKI